MQNQLLLSHENKLIVMIPTILLDVHAGLQLGGASRRSGSASPGQLETLLNQHIERLLQEEMLQEEAGSVSFRHAVIGIATFVQRFPEDVPAQRHAAAHEDPRQFPELDVRESVLSELEAASVPDCDHPGRLRSVFVCYRLRQPGELQLVGFLFQSLALLESLRKHQIPVAEVIQHVPEQNAVPVEEVSPFGVARCRLFAREDSSKTRVRLSGQRGQRGGVEDAADVEFNDGGKIGGVRSRHARNGWQG